MMTFKSRNKSDYLLKFNGKFGTLTKFPLTIRLYKDIQCYAILVKKPTLKSR